MALYWIIPLLKIFQYCIFFRVICSWIPEIHRFSVVEGLNRITDPYLQLFQERIPPLFGTIDLSPIFAMFSLQILEIGLRYWL